MFEIVVHTGSSDINRSLAEDQELLQTPTAIEHSKNVIYKAQDLETAQVIRTHAVHVNLVEILYLYQLLHHPPCDSV